MPVLLADGRWLAVERRLGIVPNGNFTAVLHRFNADGTRDENMPPLELTTGVTDAYVAGRLGFFDGPRAPHTRDTQGRIYLGVHHGDYYYSGVGAGGGKTRLFRLQPDGRPEPGFRAVDLDPVYALAATPQGVVARTSLKTWTRGGATRYATALFRLSFDGTPDSSFRTRHLESATSSGGSRPRTGLGSDFDVLTVLTDGSLLARAVGHL